jgi:hypothetical protein
LPSPPAGVLPEKKRSFARKWRWTKLRGILTGIEKKDINYMGYVNFLEGFPIRRIEIILLIRG